MTSRTLRTHPQKRNPFCSHSVALIREMQIRTHPLHSNPICWYDLFRHSALMVQQSLSNLAIFT